MSKTLSRLGGRSVRRTLLLLGLVAVLVAAFGPVALAQGNAAPGGGNFGPYNVMWSTVMGWIGFGGFTLGLIVIAAMGTRSDAMGMPSFVSKIFVMLAAMISYLALALNEGAKYAGEPAGQQFQYARFIDWSFTTPLLLLGLCFLAIYRVRDYPALVLGIMGADLAMILTGLWAGLAFEGRGAWWVWFIVSCVAFAVVYALLWGPVAKKAKDRAQMGRQMLKSENPEDRRMGTVHVGEAAWFVPMAAALSVIWFLYPINYFLGTQGINLYGLNTTTTFYTVLDLVAKPIYGIILLGGTLAIQRRAQRSMNESPQHFETDTEKALREAEEARREAHLAREEAERIRSGQAATQGGAASNYGAPSADPEEGERVRIRRTPGT